jgi:hypothetical protein
MRPRDPLSERLSYYAWYLSAFWIENLRREFENAYLGQTATFTIKGLESSAAFHHFQLLLLAGDHTPQ